MARQPDPTQPLRRLSSAPDCKPAQCDYGDAAPAPAECKLYECSTENGCPYLRREPAEQAGGGQSCCRLHNLHLLLADDGAARVSPLAQPLAAAGCVVRSIASLDEAAGIDAEGWFFDALVTGLGPPYRAGLAVIRLLRERRPWLPAIVVGDISVDAIKSGLGEDEGPTLALEADSDFLAVAELLVRLTCRCFRNGHAFRKPAAD